MAGTKHVLKEGSLRRCPRRNRSELLVPGHQEVGSFGDDASFIHLLSAQGGNQGESAVVRAVSKPRVQWRS